MYIMYYVCIMYYVYIYVLSMFVVFCHLEVRDYTMST